MIPAIKHFDPVMGVDIHLIQPPAPGPPVPIPHPFIGMILDPVDYIPVLGATVHVNGLPAAIAGTGAQPTPPHIPIGGTFVPPLPGNEGEMFMGSSTVSFDGDAASYGGLPVLSCQSVGMTPPVRPKSKKTKVYSLVLPTSTVMPVPAGAPVLIGGAPTISLMALGMRAAMSGLAKGFKKLKKTKVGKRVAQKLKKAKANVLNKLDVAKSRSRNAVRRAKCFFTGHPVDVATGKVTTDSTDLELPGPLPFRLERVWYSTSTYAGPLGYGWHHNFDLALWEDQQEGVVVVRLEDGRYASFLSPEPGTPSYNRQEQLWLRQTDEGYRVEEAVGDRRYVFGPDRTNGRKDSSLAPYRLARVEDQNGNAIRFRYDRQGHLETIIDSAGRRLTVSTDRAGRIIQLDGPHPTEPDRRVTLLRYRYDHRGDLVDVKNAHGKPLRYEYENHLLVKETDRAGVSFYFEYDGTDENARCVRTWGTDGIYGRTLDYDLEAQTTTVVDTRDAETVYHWNDLGVVTKGVDPKGAERTYTYDEDANKLSETDPLGNTTEYGYDDMGRLVTVTTPDGNTREITYDEAGNAVELTNELGHNWERRFDERGNITAVTDPEGGITRYELDRRGLPAEIIDAKDEELSLEWDDAGNLRRVIDRTGAETQLEHDRLGRLVRRIDAEGGVTELHRDVLGRITSVSDAEDRSSTFRYDAAGNLTAATDPLGRTRQFGYGTHGPGGVLDRVIEPSGVTTRYRYDEEGDLTGVRDATGRTWQFDRDEAGQVVEERDFIGRRLTYAYDAGGRLKAMTNGRGQTTLMERDAMGRLAERTYADEETETFAYDAAGRLTEAVNDTAAVEFEYDALGRITTEIQNGDAVKHRYDATGNRIERVSPEGRTLTFDYDGEGRLREVQDPIGRLMRMQRDGLGREVRRSLPAGVTTEREYSRTGELLAQRTARSDGRGLLLDRQYTYDAAGQLQRVADSRFGAKEFRHNVDGYLEQVTYPEGTVEQYLYDEAGNVPGAPVRLDTVGGDGQAGAEPDWSLTTNGEGDGGNERAIAATRVAEGWTLSYDADGNLIRKHNEETEYRFYYNAAGRMDRVGRDGQEVARFAYDALGRRIEKDTPEKTVTYRWDGDQLLSKQVERKETAQGEKEESAKREYVFSGFEPLATLSEKGDQFFETDQVGMPRMAVNRDGELVWEGDFAGFGDLREKEGTEEVEIRYPGQLYDEETGLAYNRFRYYDPELRCYTQSDPIGLVGGTRSYNYVADPTDWVDLYGLNGSCGSAKTWNEFQQRTKGEFQTRKEAATGWKVYKETNLSDQELSIGRLKDTKRAQEEGRQILDIPGEDWTPAVNDAWIQGGIDRGAKFNLETPPTPENRFNPPGSEFPTTVYHRELNQLEEAGYKQVGNKMVPPE